jgi:uncharacterized protein (DUF885 family)
LFPGFPETLLPSRIALLLVISTFMACSAQRSAPDSASAAVDDIADRYYAWALETAPEQAYFAGIDLDRHDGLHDISPSALARQREAEDAFYAEISAIDAASIEGTPQWVTHALLRQELRSQIDRRVCRHELWDVNQMGGWHLAYPQIATLQPVATAEQRDQALQRWSAYPALVEEATSNLRSGVAQGFTAPKAVVGRVISQLDGVLELPVEESPYYSMAGRANDATFATELRRIVETEIYPALRAYRIYLEEEYRPAAREALTITANPDGEACYEASLRTYTTLDQSGKAVFELGQATVRANREGVVRLGQKSYGSDDFASILEAAKTDPADIFTSKEDVLAFAVDTVQRAEKAMPAWVGSMPTQSAEVLPFPEHEEGTGRSARYEPGNDERPGRYRIPLHEPESQSRGNVETTAFHEVWPGHHLQVAAASAAAEKHAVTRLIWFSGPGEGWARYSEALAEEMGLYSTTSGPILRRAWPARGMVVDPGIHLFGWTREQAVAFMLEAGRFSPGQADAMVDRIAILPGQLTAYDSGGLEILALRRAAEAALGNDFDIRVFHDRVLEHGTIPLGDLRRHIRKWLADTQATE